MNVAASVYGEHGAAAGASLCCRFCGAPLGFVLVDLGVQPLCESFLSADRLNRMEPFYPLKPYACGECLLVQLEAYVPPEAIFTEYAYFSSYSDTWLAHARDYVATIVERLGLGRSSRVVEVASNDGYLLRNFVDRGIPALGIDPARNVAAVARERGVATLSEFFDLALAERLVADGWSADLIVGNNVLAQVTDLNGFVAGLKRLLRPSGVITLEFPHLLRLIAETQYDTIYHEHFSYFSLATAERIFAAHGLALCDVEILPTHGGSLRVHLQHAAGDRAGGGPPLPVRAVLAEEAAAGLDRLETYGAFRRRVEASKRRLLAFLIAARDAGRSVVGYGAPGKGNTLLNYCGVRTDLLDYTVDRNPHKQGLFLPGTRIPVHHPDRIRSTRPAYVLILPWNLRREIMSQMCFIREWGGRFVVPIPEVTVFEPTGAG